jgi:hypothetical protein
MGTHRQLPRTPDLLDPPSCGHTVHHDDGQDLGLLLGEPGEPFRLHQLGDALVKPPLRRELDMAAVVENLHARRLELPGEPSKRQPDVSDGNGHMRWTQIVELALLSAGLVVLMVVLAVNVGRRN